MQREKFYIFLDIDGVLNSLDYVMSYPKGTFFFYDISKDLTQNLNKIVKTIEEKFELVLVISSSWRVNMYRTCYALGIAGLKYDGMFFQTEYNSKDRGDQISDFIKKEDVNRYLIIDDETSDIVNYHSDTNILKTTFKEGLTKDLSDSWIKKFLTEVI